MTNNLKLLVVMAGIATLGTMSMNAALAEEYTLKLSSAELETVSGAESVYRKIHDAAIEVCDEQYGGFRIVRYRAARERCIVEIVDDAVAQAESETLSAVHARYL